MSEPQTLAAPRKGRLFYGWIIMAISWCIYLMFPAPAYYGINVVSTGYVTMRGWDSSVIGLAVSVHSLSAAIAAVPIGALYQKKGARFSLALCGGLSALCYLILATLNVSAGLYPLLFLGVGIGSSCALLASSSLVNAWFDKNKSLPTAVLTTAGALGGFLYPLLAERISRRNVTGSWLLFFCLAALALTVTLLFAKGKPSDIGEVRDGRAWRERHGIPFDAADSGVAEGLTVREASRSRQFYFLGILVFGYGIMFSGFTSYASLCAIRHGISAAGAAGILSCYSITSLGGRILTGAVDKLGIRKKYVSLLEYAVTAAGMAILAFASAPLHFYLAAVLCGFGAGIHATVFALLIPEYFGNRSFSVLYGAFNTVSNIGSTLAPLAVYALATATGSFRVPYLIISVYLLVCTGISLLMKPWQGNGAGSAAAE